MKNLPIPHLKNPIKVSAISRSLLLCFLAGSALAADEPTLAIEQVPKVEIGIAGGSAYSPDYPAAEQNHFHHLVFPYIIYRGENLRADRDGARGKLYSNRHFALEMSFGGSFPADSEDNRAREGMDDLDWLGEVGPRLAVSIARWGTGSTFKFYLPIRAVFSTDFQSLDYRGFTYSPLLALRLNDFIRDDWVGFMQLTGNFGTRTINAYFYDVSPEDARPDRPFYDARAGYVGTDLFSGLSIQLPKRIRLFFGGVLSYTEGSANMASPLFKNRVNMTGVTGLMWAFYESKTTGAVTD